VARMRLHRYVHVAQVPRPAILSAKVGTEHSGLQLKEVAEDRPLEEILHSSGGSIERSEGSAISWADYSGRIFRADHTPPLGIEKPYPLGSDESGCASHQHDLVHRYPRTT